MRGVKCGIGAVPVCRVSRLPTALPTHLPACRGDTSGVLQRLGELPFVPTERFRLQLCASGACVWARGAVVLGLGCLQGVRCVLDCAFVVPSVRLPVMLGRTSPSACLTFIALVMPAGVGSLHPAVADRLPGRIYT